MVDQELLKIALSCGVSVDEIKEVIQRMGNCGIKAAEAVRKLGIAMMKYRYFLTNVSYKKMLRQTPKRKRKMFLNSVRHWEINSNQSRYRAVFNRSGDGQRITFGI